MISMLLLLALTAGDVPAPTVTPSDTPASTPAAAPAAPAPPKKDEMVCHNEKDLGSNLPHRVCRHQSEIDARAAHDRDAVQQMQMAPH